MPPPKSHPSHPYAAYHHHRKKADYPFPSHAPNENIRLNPTINYQIRSSPPNSSPPISSSSFSRDRSQRASFSLHDPWREPAISAMGSDRLLFISSSLLSISHLSSLLQLFSSLILFNRSNRSHRALFPFRDPRLERAVPAMGPAREPAVPLEVAAIALSPMSGFVAPGEVCPPRANQARFPVVAWIDSG